MFLELHVFQFVFNALNLTNYLNDHISVIFAGIKMQFFVFNPRLNREKISWNFYPTGRIKTIFVFSKIDLPWNCKLCHHTLHIFMKLCN